MSGPKISVYSLTGRARTIVNGQIRCEQQSIACASKTESVLKSLLSSSGNFDKQINKIKLLIKRTGDGTEQLHKINQLQESLKKDALMIERELKANMPHVSTKYRITEEAYTEKQTELKKLQALLKRAEDLKQSLDSAFAQDKRTVTHLQTSIIRDLEDPGARKDKELDLSYLSRNDEANTQQIQKSIINDISGIYSFDTVDEPGTRDTRFEEKKSALSKALLDLLNDESLPINIINDIKQAIYKLQMITELHNLTTFDAITVTGLFKRINAYNHEREQKLKEFEDLTGRYKALCVMAGMETKALPYSEEAKAEIIAEIEKIELSLVRQKEQAYIAECVDEVMEEMGYDLIGTREVKKKNGKRFRNELFSFNEGTAVNVTFSPDGQISMELGGLAREDRIPTVEEADVLTHDMKSFCGEFAEFERKLRERGVIIGNRIALSPPSAEYAAIINVNDYDVKESTQITEMNAKEKRRKVTERKTMRRDD